MALTDKLTAIADAIRAKTGTTGGMTLEQMPSAIAGIETGGGGGSVDGYATVTFMNGDEVLFSRLVLKGDDCPDPYVQNRIELPTKESTAQYTYTFNGWATADGGSADSNALKGITEDKVLYAAFNANLVYFTVNFYDGDTLLKTEQVGYGYSSAYTYEKPGYKFNGWTPKPTNVTANMDCYGEWEENLEITDSWDEIIAAAEDGTYATKYKIGMYKPLDLGSEGVIRMQIVQTKANDVNLQDYLNDGVTRCAITFVAMDLLATKKKFNETGFSGTAYGWSSCDLRSYLQNTIMPLVPQNVSAAIKGVKKTSLECINGYRTNNYTEEYLWIPSIYEVVNPSITDEGRGACYQKSHFTSKEFRKRTVVGTSANTEWWLRSLSSDSDTIAGGHRVLQIGSTGGYSGGSVIYVAGVCIGFCI